MAYDEHLGDRINEILKTKNVSFYSKKMMGGLIFMVNEKMTYGMLMAKIGETAYEVEIKKEVCLPMDFTGRPMKGYIFIIPKGFDLEADLKYWIDKALEFNKMLN